MLEFNDMAKVTSEAQVTPKPGLSAEIRRLVRVFDRATERQIHVLVGCIDAANSGSIALHTKLGFTHAGTIKEAGFKFGRWLDAAFYQLNLEMPAPPVDG